MMVQQQPKIENVLEQLDRANESETNDGAPSTIDLRNNILRFIALLTENC